MGTNQQRKHRYLDTQHLYSTLNNILGGKEDSIFSSFPLSEGQCRNRASSEIPLRQ
jgi:hypothetical protein